MCFFCYVIVVQEDISLQRSWICPPKGIKDTDQMKLVEVANLAYRLFITLVKELHI